MSRAHRTLTMLLCVSALVSGCSASVRGTGTAGTATGGGPTSSGPATTAPATTAPAEPTAAPAVGPGTVVESHRLAAAVALTGELLPDYDDTCDPYGPFLRPGDTEGDGGVFAAGTAAPVLQLYGYVAGWASCRTPKSPTDPRGNIVFVAELSDPASATEAADLLVGTVGADRYTEDVLEGFPDARVLLRNADQGAETTFQVLVPVGRLLVYLFHTDPDGDRARRDLSTVLGAELDLAGGFTATPQDEISRLDPDPFDLARRAVEPPGEQSPISGTYDLASYLRVAISSRTEREALVANGYVGTYVKQTAGPDGFAYQVVVYELGSRLEADVVYQFFRRVEETEFTDRTPFAVPEDATIPCYRFQPDPEGAFYQRCYVRENEFLASIDVYGVTDPADVVAIRGLNTQQIALLRAP